MYTLSCMIRSTTAQRRRASRHVAARLSDQDYALLEECGSHRAPDLAEIDRLVDAGADINVRDRNGNTPLILAHACPSAVRHLVRKEGIDLYAKNKQGRTPKHVASFRALQVLLWEGERGEPVPSFNLDDAPRAVTAAAAWIRDNLPKVLAKRHMMRLQRRLLKIRGDEHGKAVLPLIGDMHGLDMLCVENMFDGDVLTRAIAEAPPSLTSLRICLCTTITMLPGLSHLVNLRVLQLVFCTSLKVLPISIGVLPNLAVLRIFGHRSCMAIPSIVLERAHPHTGDDADAVLNYMVALATPLRVRRLLIALWGEGRRRRRADPPDIAGTATLVVWHRLPREALANVLLWLWEGVIRRTARPK